MSYQVCKAIREVTTCLQTWAKIAEISAVTPFGGYLGPYMTKIWIFAKPSKSIQKASLGIKVSRSHPKRAWGAYLHPTGTLWGSWPNTEISWFWHQNLQVETSDVPYGCKYSPKALFLKVFDFFGKNRIVFVPLALLRKENSPSCDDLKKINLVTFFRQNSDFGEIVVERRRVPAGTRVTRGTL